MLSRNLSNLSSVPVSNLKGVGPKKQALLAQKGIHTSLDVLRILPKKYQQRIVCNICEIKANETALFSGTVLRAQFIGRHKFRRVEIIVQDKTGNIHLVFFNTQELNLKNKFAPGKTITVLGEVSNFKNHKQIVHPRTFEGDKTACLKGLWPVYPEIQGVFPTLFSKLVESSLAVLCAGTTIELIPENFLLENKLSPLKTAFQQIHKPTKSFVEEFTNNPKTNQAYRRMAFEEILHLQTAMQKRRWYLGQNSSACFPSAKSRDVFSKLFDFPPTRAQLRVTEEIFCDLNKPIPMARMLQGDVGSGKTAVASSACFLASKSNLQSVLMAPTEILARQHFTKLNETFSPHGIKVVLLTGSLTNKEKKQTLNEIRSTTGLVVIGTHALLTENVEFNNLSLAIIDEQQRFGVDQRATLYRKGKVKNKLPHLLAMSATPIPRSLALTMYGDFDISVIDEMPKGRLPVQTRVLYGEPFAIVKRIVQKMLFANEQGYIVFPLVEESEKLDLANAKSFLKKLCEFFSKDRIDLVYGGMKSSDKEEIMCRFKNGQLNVLISTTVIEVGVDVPNASQMVIVNAERFGLSQLHQLRGRVGRGNKASFCYLVSNKQDPESLAYKRLSIMEQTNDGFKIAAEDLNFRGYGDFLGTRQSGIPLFQFADLKLHADLVEPARQLAKKLLATEATNEATRSDLKAS